MSPFEDVLSAAYVDDIVGQPDALAALLSAPPDPGVDRIDLGDFRRVILTGMGTSHYATYPAWYDLVAGGVAAWWIATDELLNCAAGLLDHGTLVVLTSQSGQSAESLELIRRLAPLRANGLRLLAITNDLRSPAALRSDWVVHMRAGAEHSVSTRSYVNSIAAAGLVGDQLLRRASCASEYAATSQGMRDYLAPPALRATLQFVADVIGVPRKLVIVGRGKTLASARTGALVIKEAAKFHAEALSSGAFRHGPMELADQDLWVVILEGDAGTLERDRRLAADLHRLGATVAWIGPNGPATAIALPTPSYIGVGREVAQILPLQLLSVAIAVLTKQPPGIFRNGTKVTTIL